MSRSNEVNVWDPLVRVFHWSLVLAFAITYLTGEGESGWHETIGYVVLGLIGVRVIWGLIGTKHARFSDFVFQPATILGYAKDLVAGKARRYLGHNPLGGAMVLALLASVSATALSGLAVQEPESEAQAAAARLLRAPVAAVGQIIPAALADDDGDAGRETDGALKEMHEFFANVTLLLIFLHVAGVIVSSRLHRENLVRAMLTGRKPGAETPQ
jgi:cytochrome b